LSANTVALMANAKNMAKLRMVERMDSSLPIGRLLACPCPWPSPAGMLDPAYACRLIAKRTLPL
jgi:hypothetical protein